MNPKRVYKIPMKKITCQAWVYISLNQIKDIQDIVCTLIATWHILLECAGRRYRALQNLCKYCTIIKWKNSTLNQNIVRTIWPISKNLFLGFIHTSSLYPAYSFLLHFSCMSYMRLRCSRITQSSCYTFASHFLLRSLSYVSTSFIILQQKTKWFYVRYLVSLCLKCPN